MGANAAHSMAENIFGDVWLLEGFSDFLHLLTLLLVKVNVICTKLYLQKHMNMSKIQKLA